MLSENCRWVIGLLLILKFLSDINNPLGLRGLVGRSADSQNIRSFTDVVRASLGTHVRCQVLHRLIQVVFSGYYGFRPPLINDWLDIKAIFLKGP